MEKLGVVIDDEKVKTAGVEKRCPKCGKDLAQNIPGNVTPSWYCPNCGTEPFEKRPEK